jgi:hypothetical protein
VAWSLNQAALSRAVKTLFGNRISLSFKAVAREAGGFRVSSLCHTVWPTAVSLGETACQPQDALHRLL